MRRAAVGVAVAAAVAAAAAGGWWWRRRAAGGARAAGAIGAAAGDVVGRIAAAGMTLEWRSPQRCLAEGLAVAVGGAAPPLVLVTPPGASGPVRLGVVADARGASVATLASAARVHDAFVRARVDAVIVLGGIGDDGEAITAVLAALAGTPALPLVGMPGDREPADAWRLALAALAARGPIVDGLAHPIVVVRGVTIGLLSGVPAGINGLVAGADGCVRRDEDTAALARALAAAPAPRVLASHAPPRQQGADATDVALGGAHMGDPTVTRAAAAADVVLVVHGLIDEAAGLAAPDDAGRLVVAAGPLEGAPARLRGGAIFTGGAVIVEIDGARAQLTKIIR